MIDLSSILIGRKIELPQMLEARERRMYVQQSILQKYPTTLISFTLNIPGPVKVFPLALMTYQEGVELIRYRCKACGIPLIYEKELLQDTGHECFFSTPADPVQVKQQLSYLEDQLSIGRLFDIDILKPDGEKVSRSELGLSQRKCLICGQPAFVCSRARSHSLTELLTHICSLMQDYFSQQYIQKAAANACRGLLYEVLATPKPGLVDKCNTGAHEDMDISTFETSAFTLLPYFRAFVLFGMDHWNTPPEKLLSELRALGPQAETDMLRATQGVNTHKGAIFSMGLLLCGLGICYGKSVALTRGNLRQALRPLCVPLEEELRFMTTNTSHGEKLYQKYGIRGARGEAADGFPMLFDIALPVMDQLLASGCNDNDAGVVTLLHIIAHGEDTNIISRSSRERMLEISEQIRTFLEGKPSISEIITFACALDRQWIREHISPGGSADMLALAYFIVFMEREGCLQRDIAQ